MKNEAKHDTQNELKILAVVGIQLMLEEAGPCGPWWKNAIKMAGCLARRVSCVSVSLALINIHRKRGKFEAWRGVLTKKALSLALLHGHIGHKYSCSGDGWPPVTTDSLGREWPRHVRALNNLAKFHSPVRRAERSWSRLKLKDLFLYFLLKP